ncbi:sugar nucleotide-binding protein [Paenibacillus alginolyticus]|uniref:dTDP-4-dehydrorhamnose reductase n=1 Tax=Paenibacillus alginolyticus TaxID=59839 RepID=A0ABT4GG14_9BACL|nr:sugar nucleotide-binding protein [Paenibacillus alginolyticus]MCY9695091.1 sugar nucleotide-binding protein [Paenibacillus alginolyticus]MEC0147977.1 sugar nucleotide-binding protein [Paenibacillus alginolyticus]
MKIIIFGVSGTVGKALTETLTGNHHDVYGSYHLNKPSFLPSERKIQLPIGELDLLDKFLSQVNPDFVVMALRGDFVKQLKFHVKTAEFLRNTGGRMIFCSTSNVFDASIDSPHYEEDPPSAASDYGQFKAECERELAEILFEKLTIVRIPALFGHDTPRTNELRQQLQDGESIKIYTNLYSTRNTDQLLSMQLTYLMEQGLSGIYHLGTTDIMNHSEFTKKLLTRWGYTDVAYEELMQDTFSSIIPEKYDNSLLTNNPLPKKLQINHEQLIEYLS